MIRINTTLLMAAFSLLSVLSAKAQPLYTVTDLGTLGYGSSNATSINNGGEVGGNTQGLAFLYYNGAMHDIGAGLGSSVWELNDKGEAIGTAGDPNRYYFIYTAGTLHPLTTPNSNVVFTNINDGSERIGYIAEPDSDLGFRYINGRNQTLGTLDGNGCVPYGINSRGQIVGYSGHAFLYDNGHMEDLGGLGPNSSKNATAYAINDHAQVVGFGYLPSQNVTVAHAFFYTGGLMRDIGTLPGYTGSVAVGINNSGEIVGYCYNASSGATFLYVSGKMYNLTTLLVPGTGWTITTAAGINDSGQIAATGAENNVAHALLLTPTLRK